MGMRAQVHIKDTGVYLYTHWGSESLLETVRETINQGWRLDDPEYFTRILFENMIDAEGQRNTETGFGIGTSEMGGLEYPPIEVDLENKTLTYRDNIGEFKEDI